MRGLKARQSVVVAVGFTALCANIDFRYGNRSPWHQRSRNIRPLGIAYGDQPWVSCNFTIRGRPSLAGEFTVTRFRADLSQNFLLPAKAFFDPTG